MMSFLIKAALNFFILIPAFIALIRFKKINTGYYPFIFLLWFGVLNECVGLFAISYFKSNAVNSNIYCFAESLIITYLFNTWKLFNNPKVYYALLILFPVAWAAENFVFGSILSFNSFFTVFYSFIIVLESVIFINKLLISEQESLLKNAQFIICLAFLIFFTYNLFIEIWWKYSSGFSNSFNISLHNIFIAINLFINILFSYAILCMRPKSPSSIQ